MAITYIGAGTATFNSTSSNQCIIAYPAGILAGDVLVVWVTSGSATVPTATSGWTAGVSGQSGGTSPSFRMQYKVATGSESGSLTTACANAQNQGRMLLFRGVDNTNPIDVAGTVFSSSVGATAYNLPSLTTTMPGVALVYVGDANVATGTYSPPTVPATFTEVHDAFTSSPHTGSGYLIWSGSGATGTINLTRSTSIRGAAGVIALRPAVDPAVTQAAYRFYADGTETGSTALGTQDTAYDADLTSGDVNLGLRTRLQSTSIAALPATDDWQLQWEKNTSGTWTNAALSAGVLHDNYPSANRNADIQPYVGGQIRGQSFLGDGHNLTRAGFFLAKVGTPIGGNLRAVLYAHTGTFGVSGLGTGPVLATSLTSKSVVSDLATTSAWHYFDFDGAVNLANGVPYVIGVLLDTTLDGSNTYKLGVDNTTPTHGGTQQAYASPTWTKDVFTDVIFEVYTVDLAGATVVPYDSANLTDGAATTNRLGAGTGSFVAGKVSEDGLVDDLGWTGNNYTEVLYSLTLKAADLADADTLKFRVLRNGVTTYMTYTAVPEIDVTIGAGAPTVNAAAALTAVSTLTAGGVEERAAAVAMSAVSTFAAAATVTGAPVVTAAVAMTAASTLSVTAVRFGVAQAAVAMTATSTLTAAAVREPQAAVSMVAASTLTATALRTVVIGGAATPYLTEVLVDAPSVLWMCDDASGATSVADSSGNGLTGTKGSNVALGTGGTGLITGHATAATFAGQTNTTNLVDVALTPLADDAPYSVEAWVNSTTLRGWLSGDMGSTAGTSRGSLAVGTTSGQGIFRVCNTGNATFDASSPAPITDGLTHHLVGTYDGTTARVYLDGAFANSVVPTGTARALQSLRSGGATNGSNAFAGTAAGMAFYPYELSAARIAAHYAAGIATGGAPGVPLTAVSTLTADATVSGAAPVMAAVAMTAVSTLSATAVREPQAAVSMTAGSTLTVTGLVTKNPVVALTATSTLTAAAVRQPQAAVSMVAASTLTTAAVRTVPASVTLAAASTLTTAGFEQVFGSVPMTATSTLTVVASTLGLQQAAVAFTAASTLTTTALATRNAAVAMVATSTLTAAAVRQPNAAVSMVAASTFAAAAVRTQPAAVAMAAISTFAAAAVKTRPAGVALTATSTLTAAAVAIGGAAGAVALAATSTLTVTAVKTQVAAVAFTASSTLTAAVVKGRPAAVPMTATSTLTVVAVVIVPKLGAVSMVASATLTVQAVRTTGAPVSMVATATLTATAVVLVPGGPITNAAHTGFLYSRATNLNWYPVTVPQ